MPLKQAGLTVGPACLVWEYVCRGGGVALLGGCLGEGVFTFGFAVVLFGCVVVAWFPLSRSVAGLGLGQGARCSSTLPCVFVLYHYVRCCSFASPAFRYIISHIP